MKNRRAAVDSLDIFPKVGSNTIPNGHKTISLKPPRRPSDGGSGNL